jgi:hypothetical protein
MLSSGILRLVALVRTDVSEEIIASIISVIRIGALVPMLAITSNRRALRRNTKIETVKLLLFLRSGFQLLVIVNVVLSSLILFTLMIVVILSSGACVPIRVTQGHIPEDDIHQSPSRKPQILKCSLVSVSGWHYQLYTAGAS